MIPLHGRAAQADLTDPLQTRVWMLVGANTFTGQRGSRAYLADGDEPLPDGFSLYLTKPGHVPEPNGRNVVQLPPQLAYLAPGDAVCLSADGQRIRVLWRHDSRQNSVLLTERCDNYCLMCSQPPKTANDDWLIQDAFDLIRLLPGGSSDICFTGGEPTLYGHRFVELLKLCKTLIPQSAVHILSNGRRFADPEFALDYATVDNPSMMVGIPVYGGEPSLHDYVVQADGAFNDTINGILTLARLKQRIEIRVVVHKQTAPALVEIADFITRNIPFVDQVALMGLEMTGFARANVDDVWIDPTEYKDALVEATMLLDKSRIRTMIYNHQLCLIDPRIWRFAVKSISDWKNEYHPECTKCSVLHQCGGFFATANRISENVKAIPATRQLDLVSR